MQRWKLVIQRSSRQDHVITQHRGQAFGFWVSLFFSTHHQPPDRPDAPSEGGLPSKTTLLWTTLQDTVCAGHLLGIVGIQQSHGVLSLRCLPELGSRPVLEGCEMAAGEAFVRLHDRVSTWMTLKAACDEHAFPRPLSICNDRALLTEASTREIVAVERQGWDGTEAAERIERFYHKKPKWVHTDSQQLRSSVSWWFCWYLSS